MDESSKTMPAWSMIRLPLQLSPTSVHVVRVRLDLPVDRWSRLGELLSIDERERAARFRFDEPRRRFMTCRATLRQLLGHCCGISPVAIPFRYGIHGKPELALAELDSSQPPIEFSVSHSGDLGLIAVTVAGPVGIDIEELNPSLRFLKLAERFFAPSETAELLELPEEKQMLGFYRGWTSKEAYLKATGRGLSLSLSSFCVTIDPDLPASLREIVDHPDEASRWTTRSLDADPNHAAAVVVAKPDCEFECWDWPSDF